jgi:tRNA(Ile)-lysidine synthase TilS/MesJ
MSSKLTGEYTTWKEAQGEILTSLKDREVAVLFSGGKDSSVLLHFLLAASEDVGFGFEVYTASFPKHRYAAAELDKIDAFWKGRGQTIRWCDVGPSDGLLETADNPCIVCIQTRKRMLHEAISEQFADLNNLVLVTGYTLWDLASYSLEYLMGAVYTHPNVEEVQRSRERFMETGQRFYPILKMAKGFSIYRPLLRYNTQDVLRIIQETSMPILSEPCRYARYRPKRIFESYYTSMGLRFDYDRLFDFARKCLGLPSMSDYRSMSEEYFLKRKFY